MRCIERRRLRTWGPLGLAALLAACGTSPTSTSTSAQIPRQGDVVPGQVERAPGKAAPKPMLPAPRRALDWDDYRRQASLRVVAANPATSYMTTTPDPLLAIPVLEINLEADGRVRNIMVLREPTQALDTIQLAIDAVRRAAPFGSVAHLPRPWKFVEVFLFDDDRRFKPRSLDTGD